MKKKSWLLPAVAAVGGLVCLPLRRADLTWDFDGATSLLADQPRYAIPLYLAVIVFLAAALVLSFGKHRGFEKQYSSAFYARRPFWFVVAVAGGVLLFAAGLLDLMDYFKPADALMSSGVPYRATRILRMLLGPVSILAGVGIYFTCLNTRKKGEYRSVWIPLPGYVCCIWVMLCYQTWSKDPVTAHYLIPLAAQLLAMMACVFIAGFAFGKGRVTATLFLTAAAVILNIAALADGGDLYQVSLRVGLVLWLLAMNGCLSVNAARPAPPEVLPEGCTPADCASCPGCAPQTDPKPSTDNA